MPWANAPKDETIYCQGCGNPQWGLMKYHDEETKAGMRRLYYHAMCDFVRLLQQENQLEKEENKPKKSPNNRKHRMISVLQVPKTAKTAWLPSTAMELKARGQ